MIHCEIESHFDRLLTPESRKGKNGQNDGRSIPNALRMKPTSRMRIIAAAINRKYWKRIAANPTVTAEADMRALSWRVKPTLPRQIPSNPIPTVVGGYQRRRLGVLSAFGFATNSCPLAFATRRSLMFVATSTATSTIKLDPFADLGGRLCYLAFSDSRITTTSPREALTSSFRGSTNRIDLPLFEMIAMLRKSCRILCASKNLAVALAGH